MEHLMLLGETELRDLGVDNLNAREQYVASARVAGACVILDYKKKRWFASFDVEELRRAKPDQAFGIIRSKLQFLREPISGLDEIQLGIEYDAFAPTGVLVLAWIEEISRRQVKKLGRALFNL